ncbi:MAG: TetR/AcrR family transcriptional regulator [Austwickia sp.]|nr:MAG: TetR/AcrR family transcriptional regulator [Austwickia sp.]
MVAEQGTTPVRRGGYHHGNLRRALLDAGWDLVAEDGPDALTLRAVARRAGVSHGAPAHHFPDKAALVEAMAVEGWDRFAEALAQAWAGTDGTPRDGRLAAVGAAYVRFAAAHPHAFRLMNRPELRSDTGGVVASAARRCRDVLTTAILACQDDGMIPAGDPAPWAMLCWSGVHGLAMLAIDGLIELLPGGERGLEATTAVVLEAMGHGLMVRATPSDPSGTLS